MTQDDLPRSVRDLLRGLDRAALASALPGDTGTWPYASLVLVAVDHDLSPILLLSDLAEPADQMGPLHGNAIEMKILEARIHRSVRMPRQEARLRPLVGRALGAPQHRDARPGQWLFQAGRAVEQQGDPAIGLNRLGMLGKIAQQQDGRQVVVDRHQNQRSVGPRAIFAR